VELVVLETSVLMPFRSAALGHRVMRSDRQVMADPSHGNNGHPSIGAAGQLDDGFYIDGRLYSLSPR
jgi:hypothetical protein